MRNIEICFVERTENTVSAERSFSDDSLIDKLLAQNHVQIPAEQLKKNVRAVLDAVSEIFSVSDDSSSFDVEEIEFGISIGVEGKVSLLSMIGGGASANSTMVIKLKRRERH